LKEELTKAIDINKQILSVLSGIANSLCPKRAEIATKLAAINDFEEATSFFAKLRTALENLDKTVVNNTVATIAIPDDDVYSKLFETSFAEARAGLVEFAHPTVTLLPDSVVALSDADTGTEGGTVEAIKAVLAVSNELTSDINTLKGQALENLSWEEIKAIADGTTLKSDIIKAYVAKMANEVAAWESEQPVVEEYIAASRILALEEQLLSDIRAMDLNKEFYYNAHIATSMAIELNKGSAGQNTLMNPQVNYDTNNINNSFVISKLDIGFLDNGIQMARSSRLS
jgi:hypothetical protein